MNNKIITYIIGEFPSHTETFILKEMLFINKSFPLYIIVLKKGKLILNRSIYKELEDRLIYISPLLFIKSIGNHFIYTFKNKYLLQECKDILINILKGNIIICLRKVKLLLISLSILKEIKQKAISHIHSHFANFPTDVAMLVSRLSGIPFSFTAHANDIYVKPYNLAQKINEAKFVTTCTFYNKKWLDNIAFDKDKIHLLYHGVDLDYWQHNSSLNKELKQKQVLFVGRLVKKKGVIYLLKAIEQLIKEKYEIHLIIAGRGKEEQKLKKFCKLHGLSTDVTFLGWKNSEQIKKLFTYSDVLVLPSNIASDGDRDGIPNIILEAMASGLPVISTPVSGITEVIQHNHNGLLVPERNVKQLANSILGIINNQSLRNTICYNGLYTILEKFDSRKCNILLRDLIEKKL